MTEQQWLTSDDPQKMLTWRQGGNPLLPECPLPPVSDRKLRLFACAVMRDGNGGSWIGANACALIDAERVADGLISTAHLAHLHASFDMNLVGEFLLRPSAIEAATAVLAHYEADVEDRETARRQAALLRDIAGNPFQSVLMRADQWDAAASSAVLAIAQTIYTDRRFEDMPILADALEDAGCTNADILDHCRGAEPFLQKVGGMFATVDLAPRFQQVGWQPLRGPHMRGCHVLDLILGKE